MVAENRATSGRSRMCVKKAWLMVKGGMMRGDAAYCDHMRMVSIALTYAKK